MIGNRLAAESKLFESAVHTVYKINEINYIFGIESFAAYVWSAVQLIFQYPS